MAAAVSGCVIVGEDSLGVKYKKKCNYCGWVDHATSRYLPSRPGTKMTTGFYCTKCKKTSQVVVQG